MQYRLPSLTLLAAGMLLAACNPQNKSGASTPAASATTSRPAAVVDGQSISTELLEFYAKNSSARKPLSELKPEQKQELLDQLIGLQAAAQAATKGGLDKQSDTAARLELTRLNVLAEAEVAKKFGDQRPTEQELRAEYETQVAALPKLEYHARHILVATEPFAQSIIDKLHAGGDFAAIARKESMDNSKEKGGDLGWFSPARMVPEFSKAVTELKKGQITAKPVKTQFGYHIIQLQDSRPITAPDFEEVKDRLGNLVQQKKVQAYLDELKKSVKVEKKI